MNRHEETARYIEQEVRRFFANAIEAGAVISEAKYAGNESVFEFYKVSVGKLELTYMTTALSTPKLYASSGNVFED